jgi:hypothetical protein
MDVLVTGGALFHYKSRLPFLAVEKGIVHIMDDGMPSIQGCIIDGRHGCTRLGCVGN